MRGRRSRYSILLLLMQGGKKRERERGVLFRLLMYVCFAYEVAVVAASGDWGGGRLDIG